jgi:uncharacterized alkaline shock family protein YloU
MSRRVPQGDAGHAGTVAERAHRAGRPAAAGAPGPARSPEGRGRTEIAERVVEKIAGYALTEVGEAGGVARRVLGVSVGRAGARATPQVDARVDGSLATLRMTVSVVYPAPVRRVTRQLRDHVMTRVAALTGLDVRQVDVDVDTLIHPESFHGRAG